MPGSARWWDDAACASADPDLFYPQEFATTEEKREAEKAAKRICRHCQVRGMCLEVALNDNERHGVWGGLSARERKRAVESAETANLKLAS
jgi:WhiB family redox-sensing transcriptional regulator